MTFALGDCKSPLLCIGAAEQLLRSGVRTIDSNSDSTIIIFENGGYKSKSVYSKGELSLSEVYEVLAVDDNGNWTLANLTESVNGEIFKHRIERKFEYY